LFELAGVNYQPRPESIASATKRRQATAAVSQRLPPKKTIEKWK
jgi:hypothetical protein